ncbi:MAG TPA: outer membrane beta-barrel protein [Chitinophagaceae bacterium]|nr:outer membrane beta-barrel protein [Chitinophagaceae bacterium]
MRKIYLIMLLTLALAQGSRAQVAVKGRLTDLIDNHPLQGATLQLQGLRDSTVRFQALSGSRGEFRFEGLPADSFMLQVTFVGYDPFRQIVAARDTLVDLGTLALPKSVRQLQNVVVVARTPPAQMKGDTVQYNASQFKTNPDATIEDMMKKLPGVTVDKDGTVTAHGEQVKKVTIDGRDFFGDDVTAALRNLPAEVVDKIQVYDRLSDQAQFTGFDDGNTVKAVNIVTKNNMRNGQFGRIYAGYGTDGHYNAGGNVSFFKDNRRISLVGLTNDVNQQNFATQDLLGVTSSGGNRGGFGGGGGNRGGGGGNRGGGGGGGGFGQQGNFLVGQQNGISKTNSFGLNYSDQWGKKMTVSGSYFFNNSNTSNNQLTTRQTFLSPDSTLFYHEDLLSNARNFNHRLNLRLEYKIDSANSILEMPSVNFQKYNSTNGLNALSAYQASFDTASLANTSLSNLQSLNHGYNISNLLLIRHAFHKRGRTLSVGFNTNFNHKTGNTYQQANNKYFNSGFSQNDSLQQFADNLTDGYTLSANIAYTEPVGKIGQLQLNYNPSYTRSQADQETYQYDYTGGKYSLFDTTLSNKFNSIYQTQVTGVNYRFGNRDKMLSVGVNYQYSELSSDRKFPYVGNLHKTFSNLLPNLFFRRKLSARSNLNLFLRSSVNAPSVNQLQDVINNSNTLQLSTGNPGLKQQYSNNLIARYIYNNTGKGQSFFANVFVQRSANYIANASYVAVRDSVLAPGITLFRGSTLTKPINLDGYWSVRSFFTYGVPVKLIKSNINLNAGASYSKTPGLINGVSTLSNNYTYNGGVVIASNVSEYVDFTLSYNGSYNLVKNTIQAQLNNHYFMQSAGVQFNLLDKKGWFFQNDLSNQFYKGLSDGYNQNFWLWNLSAGKKILKKQAGEIKFSVFDLLRQNRSITRTATETYIEDVQSQVLRQYFMLTFTYKLKNFGNAKAMNNNFNRDRRFFGPPGF